MTFLTPTSKKTLSSIFLFFDQSLCLDYGWLLLPSDLVIRSHEVKQEGYEVTHNGKCITVFSAPNYWYVGVWPVGVATEGCGFCINWPSVICSDQMGNKGAFITLTKDLTPNFTSFSAVVSSQL